MSFSVSICWFIEETLILFTQLYKFLAKHNCTHIQYSKINKAWGNFIHYIQETNFNLFSSDRLVSMGSALLWNSRSPYNKKHAYKSDWNVALLLETPELVLPLLSQTGKAYIWHLCQLVFEVWSFIVVYAQKRRHQQHHVCSNETTLTPSSIGLLAVV